MYDLHMIFKGHKKTRLIRNQWFEKGGAVRSGICYFSRSRAMMRR